MPSLVLTVIGPDRPGLVESVASVVAEEGANWLESRMSHLAGHFAGIVRLEVAADKANELMEKLQTLEQHGLKIVAVKDETEQDTDFQILWLQLVGNDRPGIVSELTHVFSDKQVNVEEFQTELQGAPNSGAMLFRANAALRLPTNVTVEELRQALESIAQDLMVDITLAPEKD